MPSSKEYLTPELKKVQPRPRLYSYLEERKVVILEAGPGMGKTAAVYDFLKHEGKRCIWFYIKKTDSNYTVFIERLSETLHSFINSTQKNSDYRTAESSTPAQVADNFCEMIFDKLPEDIYLILEDFEFINKSPETCAVIERLLDSLSKKIHILLLTREAPNISLARVRSRKELTELKTRDLAFNREDIHNLIFNLYDMSFDSAVLERLLEVSEGWITAIIFLLEKICCLNKTEGEQILQSFLKFKSIPEIDDYFNTQVLGHLSSDFRISLIKAGAVEQFTPQLVEKLTGNSGFKMIKELQRANLFTTVKDPATYHYSFNPVFRTYLYNEFIKTEDEEITDCYSKIAEYYLEEDDVSKTVEYLSKAGAYEDAVKHLTSHADELIKNTRFEEIHRIMSFFPAEMRSKEPYLAYFQAVANNLLQPNSSRKQLLELLDTFKETGDLIREASIYTVLLTNYFFFQTNTKTVETIIGKAEAFIAENSERIPVEQGELLNALIPLGKWWTGISREQAFETALRAEETSSRLHNEEAFLCSRLVLARIYISKGEFDSAMTLLDKTEKFFSQSSLHLYGHYKNISRLYLGDAYFFSGRISNAINHINTVLSTSGSSSAFRPYLELKLILYNLYFQNIEKAEALYETARNSDTTENVYLRYYYEYLFEMLFAYRTGNKRRAEYYCKRLRKPDDPELIQSDLPFAFLAIAEVIIFTEGTESAFDGVMELSGKISREDYPYSYASATALLGYLKHSTGETAAAAEYFNEMESIIKENNYQNLDICSPELLKKIADASGNGIFNGFPRLQHKKQLEHAEESDCILKINTLGTFSVMVKDREVSADLLGGQKRVMDLLKLLLVYRKTGITKEKVYELFWPRYSYKSARDNLNTIIYRFRKLIGTEETFLYTDMVSIRFKDNAVVTDADRFIKFINIGDDAEKHGNHEMSLRMYKSAIELYKGDFLENDMYFDFISDERDNLRLKYRNLLFRMIQLSLNSREFKEALEWTKLLIDKDPLCEPAYRLLMISSAAVGNRSEIPRIFDKLNKKLQAYYKITADDKTVQIRDTLLGGAFPEPSMWKDETII